MLAQDFHRDGALAGNHVRIIVWMDISHAMAFFQHTRMFRGFGVRITMQHHLGAARAHRIDLDVGGGHRHDNGRRATQLLRRQRHALGMVAGRGRDHAAGQRIRLEVHHLVVGAAQLEREHRLHILALEQDAVVRAPRQVRRRFQRCLDRHVVDARVEDAFQIIGFSHALFSFDLPADFHP